MQLTNTRYLFTKNSTIGKLTVDGQFICYILEPYDRGLTGDMTLAAVLQKKVFGHTAIPTDTYPLLLINGAGIFDRFHFLETEYTITDEAGKIPFYVPELQTVKGFSGVLIHPGNYPKDTEGCSLVGGSIAGADFIGQTPQAFDALRIKCFDAIKAGGVSYCVQREPNAWAAFQAAESPVKVESPDTHLI